MHVGSGAEPVNQQLISLRSIFDPSRSSNRPWRKLIVFAEHDECSEEQATRAWLQSLPQPLETCFVPGVGHLFGDRVDSVGRNVADFLFTNL